MNSIQKIKLLVKSSYLNLIGKGQSPIFILGTGRCGSTLLVDILMTNTDLDINQNEQYDWFLTALPQGQNNDPIFTDLINYRLTAKKSLKNWSWFYRKKLKAILDAKVNANKKQFILKSPAITFILPEIKKMYLKAKYIHLYRHGVAVARSWAKKEYRNKAVYAQYFSEEEFVLKCAEYYNDSILEIEQFLEHIPQEDKYHISYEKLSKSPKEELATLLDFIGIKTKCAFDLKQIQRTNYKMNLLADEDKLHLEAIMQPALSKLGYK